MDAPAATPAAAARVYYTDSGRAVCGGGGIRPDLLIRTDTLTLVEQEFRSTLGGQLAAYSDAVFRFAVAYADAHPELGPDFQVTPDMLAELYAWLEDTGVTVDRDLFDGSKRLIARELGIQLATVRFDEATALRRRLVLDRQLDRAAELLRAAGSQAELFALASEQSGGESSAACGSQEPE